MDLSQIDEIKEKLTLLIERIDLLKDENHKLKRKVSSINTGHEHAGSTATGELKEKYSSLVEERDQLIMERELIRNKVQLMVKRIDSYNGNES